MLAVWHLISAKGSQIPSIPGIWLIQFNSLNLWIAFLADFADFARLAGLAIHFLDSVQLAGLLSLDYRLSSSILRTLRACKISSRRPTR